MEIRLRPDLEKLIKQDVQRGPYETVDEYVEHAVSLLHEREAWLAANRNDIQAKVAAGYASAVRGDLLDPDEARAKLAELKRSRSSPSHD